VPGPACAQHAQKFDLDEAKGLVGACSAISRGSLQHDWRRLGLTEERQTIGTAKGD